MEDKQGLARFLIFDQDGCLQFRKGGQVKLGAKFRSFYINKLQAEATSQVPRIGKPAEIACDKALEKKFTCSAKTIEYANNRKKRFDAEGCDIVESLYRKHTVMDKRNKERADAQKAAAEIDVEATFAPVTINYTGSRPQLTHGDKCLDLYSRVRPGQYAKKNIEERDAEFENARVECNFMPQINPDGSYLAKPDQTLDQIKGVKEKLDQQAKGRENAAKIKATQARNPGDGLNKKGKGKKPPQMLGPATMSNGKESSKFKSAFGKLEKVPKRLHPKAQTRAEIHKGRQDTRKLGFFDSQKMNPALFYQTGSQEELQDDMNGGPQDQMIDISDHDARIINQGGNPGNQAHQLGQIDLANDQIQPANMYSDLNQQPQPNELQNNAF